MRRDEARPVILEKFRRHWAEHFAEERVEEIVRLGLDKERMESMPVDEYVDLYVVDSKFVK